MWDDKIYFSTIAWSSLGGDSDQSIRVDLFGYHYGCCGFGPYRLGWEEELLL